MNISYILQIVTPIVAPLAFVLSIFNFLRDHFRHKQDHDEKQSLFHLDATIKGYGEARKLLLDGNNDRASWIQAARSLKHAEALTANITVDQHRRLLELHQLDYRGFFYRLLTTNPPSFFYGVDSTLSLDEAARASTAPEDRHGRHVGSCVRELPGKAIYVLWRAAQWPQDYADPLDKEFSKVEEDSLLVLFPALHDFLEHKRRYTSASGDLFPRK